VPATDKYPGGVGKDTCYPGKRRAYLEALSLKVIKYHVISVKKSTELYEQLLQRVS